MNPDLIVIVYFFYGLAFFCMGFLVAVEGGRSSDPRLRRALRPLAAFGLLHGGHEWMKMFEQIGIQFQEADYFHAISLALLSFSFLSLAAFGSYLLVKSPTWQRLIMMVPLSLVGVWVFGLAVFRGQYNTQEIWAVADVWTRYTIAIPASLLTSIGLVVQQRTFRLQGLTRFGQDALWAAVVFGWYGLIGQSFPQPSLLPPSTYINSELFLRIFGFPVQMFRAGMAILAAIFVIRFLRAFQVEIDRQISDLQKARLVEAEEREQLRSELLKRVVAAQETERQRIARELHDETGQALTAIGMGLRGASSRLKQTNEKQKPVLDGLRQLETLTTNSLNELQRLISDLRPSHLDDLGLPSALRWYAGDMEARTLLKIKVEIEGEEQEINSSVKTALFRIVQEALNNVVRHSGANNVSIKLTYEVDEIKIQINDDGKGFDPLVTKKINRIPWGLKGMEERATLLGGQFKILSTPGKGTTVRVSVPYAQEIIEV